MNIKTKEIYGYAYLLGEKITYTLTFSENGNVLIGCSFGSTSKTVRLPCNVDRAAALGMFELIVRGSVTPCSLECIIEDLTL